MPDLNPDVSSSADMPQESGSPSQTLSGPREPGIEGQEPESRFLNNPDNPPWGILAALATWLTSVGLLFFLPNLLITPYLAYYYRGQTGLTTEVLFGDKTLVFIFVCGWLPAHLLTLLLAWAVATKWGRFPLKQTLGLTWGPGFGVWKSVALAILLFAIAWAISAVLRGQETELEKILNSSRAAALMISFIAVATAPLMEEIVFRGLLYSAFQRVIRPVPAIILVASMFAGLHVWQYRQNLGVISSIFLLSLALTAVRARTGRLLPCVVIHLVFNSIQSLFILLEPLLKQLFPPQPTSQALTCVWLILW